MKHSTVVEQNTKVVRYSRVVSEQYYVPGSIISGVNVNAFKAGVKVMPPEEIQARLPPERRAREIGENDLVVVPVEEIDGVEAIRRVHVVLTPRQVLPAQRHQ